MRLRWKNGGIVCTLDGVRNVPSGVLRPLTQPEIDNFIKDFKGKDNLDEPFTTIPWEDPHANHT